jgi:cell division protein FtsB
MPDERYQSRPSFPLRRAGENPHTITSAVGIAETRGHVRARRTSLFTRTVVWVTGLICLAFLLGSLAQAWTNNGMMQNLAATELQTRQAQATHTALQQQAIHYADPSVIEREAREQLGYIRPGEHPVVIVGAQSQPPTTSSQPPKTAPQESFWQAWWSIFFG